MSTAQATPTPLPVPDNPEHTDNLSTIDLLKQQGFSGQYADLAESLREHSIIWRSLPDGGWLFVHRASHGKGWDRTSFTSETDPRKEWDWISRKDILEFVGMTEAEWDALPFPHKVADLVSYYGVEEIFGTTYWDGFQIKMD